MTTDADDFGVARAPFRYFSLRLQLYAGKSFDSSTHDDTANKKLMHDATMTLRKVFRLFF
jgi:hypothetical protein